MATLLQDIVAILAISNPLGALPIFLAITEHVTPDERSCCDHASDLGEPARIPVHDGASLAGKLSSDASSTSSNDAVRAFAGGLGAAALPLVLATSAAPGSTRLDPASEEVASGVRMSPLLSCMVSLSAAVLNALVGPAELPTPYYIRQRRVSCGHSAGFVRHG